MIIKVENIDKTPPVIKLDEYDVTVPMGDSVDFKKGVSTEGIFGKIEIDEGGFNSKVPGNYTITYTASDEVGNTSTVEKSATVYDPSAFNVIVNNKMSADKEIRLDTEVLNMEIVNGKGEVTIKYLGGKKSQGLFKVNMDRQSNIQIVLPEKGYYTFYILDEMRQSKLVQIFIV